MPSDPSSHLGNAFRAKIDLVPDEVYAIFHKLLGTANNCYRRYDCRLTYPFSPILCVSDQGGMIKMRTTVWRLNKTNGGLVQFCGMVICFGSVVFGTTDIWETRLTMVSSPVYISTEQRRGARRVNISPPNVGGAMANLRCSTEVPRVKPVAYVCILMCEVRSFSLHTFSYEYPEAGRAGCVLNFEAFKAVIRLMRVSLKI
ncbi:hypothetical protein F5146DRAFT_379130 [Armillaria mellea]|nr:hypothetical protein F5146DRAFT_379130 [Armillaria mellea]